jgi:hypothetical protein
VPLEEEVAVLVRLLLSLSLLLCASVAYAVPATRPIGLPSGFLPLDTTNCRDDVDGNPVDNVIRYSSDGDGYECAEWIFAQGARLQLTNGVVYGVRDIGIIASKYTFLNVDPIHAANGGISFSADGDPTGDIYVNFYTNARATGVYNVQFNEDGLVSNNATPSLDFVDSDAEVGPGVSTNCNETSSATCNLDITTYSDGTPTTPIAIDGDAAGANTPRVTVTGQLLVPNGTGPLVGVTGAAAVDTDASQWVYGGASNVVQVIHPVQTLCVSLTDMADQDNYPILTPAYAVTLTSVGCYCSGTCTNEAAFALEDKDANAIGTAPDCATTTNAATFTSLTADSDGVLVAGEVVRFDQTNGSLTTGDDYSLCVTYTVNRQ